MAGVIKAVVHEGGGAKHSVVVKRPLPQASSAIEPTHSDEITALPYSDSSCVIERQNVANTSYDCFETLRGSQSVVDKILEETNIKKALGPLSSDRGNTAKVSAAPSVTVPPSKIKPKVFSASVMHHTDNIGDVSLHSGNKLEVEGSSYLPLVGKRRS